MEYALIGFIFVLHIYTYAMRLLKLILLLLFSSHLLLAQWQGDVGKYEILTDSLQLNAPSDASGVAYLSKPSTIIEDATWELQVKMQFNPSGSNYASIYVVADKSDFSGNGYYVKIGGSDDEVSLFRKDGNTHTKIIDGMDDRLDLSIVNVKIKLTRSNGVWVLYSDTDNSGYQQEGQISDLNYLTSAYFGVESTYTKTRYKHFSFAHFSTSGTAFVDVIPPRLDSIVCLTKYQCYLYFNEVVNVNEISRQGIQAKDIKIDNKRVAATFDFPFTENDSTPVYIDVKDTSNNALLLTTNVYYKSFIILFATMQSADTLRFSVSKPVADILTTSVVLDGQLPNSIFEFEKSWFASFNTPIPERKKVSLTIKDILDYNGDTITRYESKVSFLKVGKSDIVINELMPDPSPKIGSLPEVEYLELYNTTDYEIDLTDWLLQRDNSTKYLLPSSRIRANGYLLIGSEAAMDSFPDVENKIAMSSFPSLVNSGMTLVLKSDKEELIDSLTYNVSWHNSIAKNGGYSLARIDVNGSSEESNFMSSCSPNGGTPGGQNCDLAPRLDVAQILTRYSAILYFNEAINVNNVNYRGKPARSIIEDKTSVRIIFEDEFEERDSNLLSFSVQDINANLYEDSINLYYTPFEVLSSEMDDATHLHFTLSKIASQVDPTAIKLDGLTPNSVILDSGIYIASFSNPIKNRTTVSLEIQDLLDENGDTLIYYSDDISFFIPELGDILFTELMPDPSPVVSNLPDAEYIELYNNSDFSINIEGWYLLKEEKKYMLPSAQLSSQEYIILMASSSLFDFPDSISAFVMASFPSLNNTSMSLQLVSPDGIMVDFVDYDKNWHEDAFKGDGGFSLERIDVLNPSQQNNWISSCSINGGTPGFRNCVAADNPDYDPPFVLSAYALDNSWIMLELSEPILITELTQLKHYELSEGKTIITALPLGDLAVSEKIMLGLSSSLADEQVYELSVMDIADLSKNVLEESIHNIAICSLPKSSDIVINEIMYAPLSGEVEYVEIYNTSNKPFDLSQIRITKPDDDASWSAGKPLTRAPELLLPHSYLALSTDIETLTTQYSIESSSIKEVTSMYSLPNEAGAVALLLSNATVIDVLHYDDEWHSPLLNSTKGVALERINTSAPTNEPTNWFSASSLVNYGTPGAENSQALKSGVVANQVSTLISPEVFTPDGDGFNDFTTIKLDEKYEAGTVRILIFNHRGMVVKELVNNALIGSYNSIRWDGTDDTGTRCPMGSYIVWVEIITPDGDVIVERIECVVSVRLR